MYFCLKMETKKSIGFELLIIKKRKLQNGSNNIHLTTFVPASDRFRRVHNAFWTKRWLGWPRCMANACIPPASTMAGLLLEQTDRTETKWYYKHYAGTKLYNTDFSNQCTWIDHLILGLIFLVSEWVDLPASSSCLLQNGVLVLVCTYSSAPANDENTSGSHFL